MSEHSKIEWTDATWPVVTGCTKVSAGCDNCYAIRDSRRLGGNPNEKIRAAYEGTTKIVNGRPNWSGIVRCLPERLDWPLKWKKPRRIFVCNESDLFHEEVPDEFIIATWYVMARCPQHTFQVLTKRPERMITFLLLKWKKAHYSLPVGLPGLALPNIWLGTSVENQPTADKRIPLLLQTPAALRFVSYEPALGPVDFTAIGVGRNTLIDALRGALLLADDGDYEYGKLNQIIAGGESGPRPRPSHPDWFRSVRDQCQAARVPFLFKQWGEWLPVEERNFPFLGDGKPRPKFYRFPSGQWMWRCGKKAAGRLLDGREWNEYPA